MSQLGVRGFGVRTLSVVLGAGALIGFGGGCFITNTSHCGFHQDGANNPCPADMVCNVCAAENNGCVPKAEAGAIEVQCRDNSDTTTNTQTGTPDPTVGPTSLPTDPTTETTTTSTTVGPTTEPVDTITETTTDTSTTEAPATTMMTPCNPDDPNDDMNCAPQYCVAQDQCGWCMSLPADKTCADVKADTPVCDTVSGECVQCTEDEPQACSGATPVCDKESHTCVPCTEHSQCATACDIQEGECFPDDPESIVYVQNNNTDCQTKDGKTEQTAFCLLSDVQLSATKTTIRLMSGSQPLGSISVPNGYAVALVRHGGQVPEINGGGNPGPTLTVEPNGRLYISQIKLRYAPGFIVKCTTGAFYSHESTWEGNGMNTSRALEADDCKTFIHRSKIQSVGSGIEVDGGELLVENSFIMDNGAVGAQFGAFRFLNDVKVRITYSTIARNRSVAGLNSTFHCPNPAGPQITLRNSAVVGVMPFSNCDANITVQNGVVQPVADAVAAEAFVSQWFNAPIMGVYTPKDGPNVVDPLEDKAMWETGDPKFDHTKTPIPTDVPSFAGAKQPL